MAHCKILFDTDNEAFVSDGRAEAARILRDVAKRIANDISDSGNILDANGNSIGTWSITLPEVDS